MRIFLAVALLLSPALMAADLSYRYVEINGVFGESGGEDSTGIGFEGSYDLGGVVFVTAGSVSYTHLTLPTIYSV